LRHVFGKAYAKRVSERQLLSHSGAKKRCVTTGKRPSPPLSERQTNNQGDIPLPLDEKGAPTVPLSRRKCKTPRRHLRSFISQHPTIRTRLRDSCLTQQTSCLWSCLLLSHCCPPDDHQLWVSLDTVAIMNPHQAKKVDVKVSLVFGDFCCMALRTPPSIWEVLGY